MNAEKRRSRGWPRINAKDREFAKRLGADHWKAKKPDGKRMLNHDPGDSCSFAAIRGLVLICVFLRGSAALPCRLAPHRRPGRRFQDAKRRGRGIDQRL